MVDNEEDMETEALEGVDPANYVPRNNTKHKLLRTSSNEVPSHDTSGDNAVWGQGHGARAVDVVMAVEIKVQVEVED